jgi:hypothetical protein
MDIEYPPAREACLVGSGRTAHSLSQKGEEDLFFEESDSKYSGERNSLQPYLDTNGICTYGPHALTLNRIKVSDVSQCATISPDT